MEIRYCLIHLAFVLMFFSQTTAQLIQTGDAAQQIFIKMYAKIQKVESNPFFVDSSELASVEFRTEKLTQSTSKLEKSFYSDAVPIYLFGLINAEGDTLKPVFDGVMPWTEDKSLVYKDFVNNDHYEFWAFVIDENYKASEVYYLEQGQYIVMRKNDKWGVIKRDDLSEDLPFEYDEIKIVRTWELDGKEVFAVPAKKNNKWGLEILGLERNTVFIFEDIAFTSSAVYGTGLMKKEEGQWCLQDKGGNYIVPFAYDSIRVVNLDRLIVKLGGKWAHLWKDLGNSSRWYQTSFEFETFEYGYECSCVKKGGKWGIVENTPRATPITGFEYDGTYGSEWGNVVPLQKNTKWGFYDCKKKEFITEFIYDEIRKIDQYEAVVVQNGKELTIDY